MSWTTSPTWHKSAPAGSDESPKYRISTLSPTHLPHQPRTALWGTQKWCWSQQSTGCSAAHRTRLFVHSILMAQQQDDTEHCKWFFLTCGQARKHQSSFAHCTENERCLGATGCNVFPLILLPAVTCRSAPGEEQPVIRVCRVPSLTTNRYHQNKPQQCFPTPFLPQTTEVVITRVCCETREWPKNLEFQTKMMHKWYIYSLSFLEMPVNKAVAVEQLCRLNNSRPVCKADFLKSARHLQCRSTNGQRAKAPTWRKIKWQIKEV